ncbi:MAG: LysM peptidoglycan-binding domain-containing protein [Burkholderiales bacterium]|nr:LysM peptidoglycan-binding domain-containing protein [Burkholderiales bacterium]
MRVLATLAAAAAAGVVIAQSVNFSLQETAPDRYTVQKGDTLWGISGKFLKEPWRWPEIWRLNKEQIKNPHLIYPGDVIVLDRGAMQLSLADRRKLTPRIRGEQMEEAIPSIPANAIEPWLSRPLVIEEGGLAAAPRIVATEEGRFNIGTGSRAYVSGMGDSPEKAWLIYRQGAPLIDPDTNRILGFEAVYLGSARVIRTGDPTTVFIVQATQEIGPGDRLIPAGRPQLLSYVPKAPAKEVRGRIIAVYGGRSDVSLLGAVTPALATPQPAASIEGFDTRREAGPLMIVSLNRGIKDGLTPGDVLAINRDATINFDRSVGPFYMGHERPPNVHLPQERYGLLFVFRTFDNISYGLVMRADRPVLPGDVLTNP